MEILAKENALSMTKLRLFKWIKNQFLKPNRDGTSFISFKKFPQYFSISPRNLKMKRCFRHIQ